ncbi:ATP phosphoribosyltransferase [Candidatus Nitronereus thalassa]|uniref:ATP phosphoribosyltransferase n=1 Tax=Candidatus Nitronereus thalassa TaxID=3020898 RepID=A0ABU3KAS9_9BACT|nr:ATP phosphoribosyltransferase [Candidatus Nitronereus thalassa]MDT7043423.1 ATP phosphoribosyltransferase [Candidatus Nitronereus thalassa]
MSETVIVALSKGKLLDPTIELFRQAGYAGPDLDADPRRLIFEVPQSGLTFLIVRPTDVPTYVEYGAADVGIAGKDLLLEQRSDVHEPLDLRIGGCRIAVAGLQDCEGSTRLSSKLRVATKYPNITERYFNQKGIPVEIIKLYGSMELAPLVGLADRIVDLVSSGQTLKANNLKETEVIEWSTARLIVNRASLKMKHRVISQMIERLKKCRPKTMQC